MNTAGCYLLTCLSIAVLAACGKGEVTPAARPDATATNETAPVSSDSSVHLTKEIHLAEEIVDPDVNEPLTSDEDVVDAIAQEPTDAVVLGDTQGEVTLKTVQTSSLRATDAQAGFAELAARHNREARQQASLAPADATAQRDDAATAAVAEEGDGTLPTTAAQASKPAAQAPAIDEKQIIADPKGQWAATAVASSTYAQTTGEKAGYTAWQATGKPNVPRYADDPSAWTTKSGDAKEPEWLELGFAKPIHATSIRIRQTAAPGAISKIELIDSAGAMHELWSGTDDTPYQKDTIGWLVKDFPRTDYIVKGARITLLTARVWGWNEIDAVQLVGEP